MPRHDDRPTGKDVPALPLSPQGRVLADSVAVRRLLGLGSSLRGRSWQSLLPAARRRRLTLRLEPDQTPGAGWQLCVCSAAEPAAQERTQAALQHQAESFAMLSHELRTPLNALLGMAQLLEQSPLDAEQRSYLDTLTRSGELLTSLINDILDAARIDLGHLQLETRDFDLERLIDELLLLLTPKAISKGLELSVHFAPQTCFQLAGDAQRLRQILFNLIGNALKFTAHGHIHLDIATRIGAEGVKLSITVEDTGIGMSEQQIQGLFKSFSQGHAAIHRQYGGSGLGLTISRSLARLMQGDIWVHSVPQQGSVFGLGVQLQAASTTPRPSLPEPGPCVLGLIEERPQTLAGQLRAAHFSVLEGRSCAAAEHWNCEVLLIDLDLLRRQACRQPFSAPVFALSERWSYTLEQEAAQLGAQAFLRKPLRLIHLLNSLQWRRSLQAPGMITMAALHGYQRQQQLALQRSRQQAGWKVLVVDDNPVNLLVSRRSLERLGCQCTCVEQGEQALAQAREQVFDLVLMDCEMPGMDGRQTTRALRLLDAYQHVPIVALTAHTVSDERSSCLAAGMNEVLSKPLPLDSLVQLLERHLPGYAQDGHPQLLH